MDEHRNLLILISFCVLLNAFLSLIMFLHFEKIV